MLPVCSVPADTSDKNNVVGMQLHTNRFGTNNVQQHLSPFHPKQFVVLRCGVWAEKTAKTAGTTTQTITISRCQRPEAVGNIFFRTWSPNIT